MTFAHVKNSKAFDVTDLLEIDEVEEGSTHDESYFKDGGMNSDLYDSRLKKSEDGWNLSNKLKQ